jgi:hypothetical protein
VSTELHLILNVAMAMAIALVGTLVAHRLRQSMIVGYLLAGMVMVRSAREEDETLLRRLGATAVMAPERAGATLLLSESARARGPRRAARRWPGTGAHARPGSASPRWGRFSRERAWKPSMKPRRVTSWRKNGGWPRSNGCTETRAIGPRSIPGATPGRRSRTRAPGC